MGSSPDRKPLQTFDGMNSDCHEQIVTVVFLQDDYNDYAN